MMLGGGRAGGSGPPGTGGFSFPSASFMPQVLPAAGSGVSGGSPSVIMPPTLMGLGLGLGSPSAPSGSFGAQAAGGDGTPKGDSANNGWTEHVGKDGRKYYYNASTQQSQWEKPECLMTEEEQKVYHKLGWIKYATAEGKEYWFNSYTKKSTWSTPKEVDECLRHLAEEKEEWPKFTNKAEARRWIVKLFELKRFPPRINWENAVKFLEADKRWESFKILTRGERKQSFSEYMSQRQKKSADTTRKKKQEARAAFTEALQKWDDIVPGTTYIMMADKMNEEDWWRSLTEQERDDCFQDYMEEFEKRYRELYKKKRKKDVETVEEILEKRSAQFDCRRKWMEVKDELFAIPELATVLKLDILQVWENWVEHGFAGERKKRRHVVFRRERKRRDAFRALLDEAAKKGELTFKTEWREFVAHVVNDPRYYQMVGQGGSTPRELFEDAVENVKEEYQKQKAVIKDCLKKIDLDLESPTLTFEKFYSALCACDGMKGVSLVNAKLAFESLASAAAPPPRNEREAEGPGAAAEARPSARRGSRSRGRSTASWAPPAKETPTASGASGSSSRRKRDGSRGRDGDRGGASSAGKRSSSSSSSSARADGRAERERDAERKRRRSHSSRSSSPRRRGKRDDENLRKRRHG
ncbi:hypothetical protein BESB_083980 [Besnoitia besnoiti]|uniref:WW domain protein n=1 Tax=Besnoitia besnoiti TaxID=94643 RepID=A0A2A9M5H3_BESBE|nr:hypothetical protein BESB_083980 [Besnoitia besnoiti]PFH33199.1 hypothetical protein BESB_083980 [Besnoitia besnoiti]